MRRRWAITIEAGRTVKHVWFRVFFYLLQFTWGLPVNLFGALAYLWFAVMGCRQERFHLARITYAPSRLPGGLSLGIFLFIAVKKERDTPENWTRANTIHEYGHTLQVLLLGPLYWFVIALPSVLWYALPAFAKYRRTRGVSYYRLYSESWANQWGARACGR